MCGGVAQVWSGVGNTRDPSAGKPVQSNALKMPHMLLCPLDSVLEYVVGDAFYKEPHQMFRTTDRPMASVHLFEFCLRLPPAVGTSHSTLAEA